MLHCGSDVGSGDVIRRASISQAFLCSTDVIMLDVVISLMFEACYVLYCLATPALIALQMALL